MIPVSNMITNEPFEPHIQDFTKWFYDQNLPYIEHIYE